VDPNRLLLVAGADPNALKDPPKALELAGAEDAPNVPPPKGFAPNAGVLEAPKAGVLVADPKASAGAEEPKLLPPPKAVAVDVLPNGDAGAAAPNSPVEADEAPKVGWGVPKAGAGDPNPVLPKAGADAPNAGAVLPKPEAPNAGELAAGEAPKGEEVAANAPPTVCPNGIAPCCCPVPPFTPAA